VVKKLLKYLNIPVIWDSEGLGHEADDYIAYLSKVHKGRVTIISSDKDFGQLLEKDRVKIYNPAKEVLIRESTCKEYYGYEPHECVDYLCLVGDKSDDIPGYQGIGPVKARKFLDSFGSIVNYLENPKAKFRGIDREGLEYLYQRNPDLIDLKLALEKYPIEKVPIIYSKFQQIHYDKWARLLNKYTLRTFMNDEFLEPFKRLKVWQE